ncbi:MAG: tetraacyldisaccharide 4'-kinase [Hyphomicrobiales bacterium]|nr:tetraacyldisaccharide 4'-kinase [Hyphomicrobiales bacterium]
MRAPAFWWRSPGPGASLLQPLGALYGAIAARRMSQHGMRSPLPVICIGNFSVGGTGKTPFAIELARHLLRIGERPAFLTRGYGGTHPGPLIVEPSRHSARDVGDEAGLLARHAVTIVARARDAGASLAASVGASVIVMDDGLQNSSLAKDFTFAMVDGETGIGNGFCLPAGPLRAPLAAQWPFVQAVVMVGKPRSSGQALKEEATRRGLPVLPANLVPDPEVAAALRGQRVVAFAGIGRPEKFFASLQTLGALVVAQLGFGDHHRFTMRELARVSSIARAHNAVLVTTEKDGLRVKDVIRPAPSNQPDSEGPAILGVRLLELPVHLQVWEETELQKLIARALFIRRGSGAEPARG